MSNGNFSVFPVVARPGCGRGSDGMTYRQHLVVQIAPIMLTNFFSNDAWQDYDDLVRTLVMAVDAIIEAERETTK
ncbi:hypothetical protein CRQ31_19145 [Salmonella enterica subsp. enterica serovar Worthington]|nr:hypothetical protein [Salmonella enterica subsp. enterica serovar Worthington]